MVQQEKNGPNENIVKLTLKEFLSQEYPVGQLLFFAESTSRDFGSIIFGSWQLVIVVPGTLLKKKSKTKLCVEIKLGFKCLLLKGRNLSSSELTGLCLGITRGSKFPS